MSLAATLGDVLIGIPSQYQHRGLTLLLAKFEDPHADTEALLWSHIQDHQQRVSDTDLHRIPAHATYIIWQRWLSGPEHLRPSHDILKQANYWSRLCDGLRSDDRFSKKFSLDLLLRSIELLSGDVHIEAPDPVFHFEVKLKAEYVRQYREFGNLYEIIVFNGYINQVKEALSAFPDISILESPGNGRSEEKSLISSHFWTALLSSALRTQNDALCDRVGSWLLGSPYTIQIISYHHMFLTTGPFLQWASAARHFTASVSRTEGVVSCSHGDRLAAFCSNLISVCRNDTIKFFYVDRILNAIGPRSLSSRPATIYLLQGIAASVRSIDWQPTQKIVESALSISRAPEFSATQRLFVTAHCRTISGSQPEAANLLMQEQDLKRKIFEATTTIIENVLCPNIDSVQSKLEHGLAERKLLSLCQALTGLLQSEAPNSGTVSTWCSALEFVWTESDVKEHPRDVVVLFPGMMLHPAILRSTISHSAFQAFLSGVVLELYNLAVGRMYLWNELAKSFLMALLRVPEAFDFLPMVEVFERFVNCPPNPTSEYLVDLAASRTVVDERGQCPYTIFADEEYGHACMFDILNRLGSPQQDLARRILDRLLSPWLKQLETGKTVPMISKWKRTAQLQAIIILLESAIDMNSERDFVNYRDKVSDVLSVEPLPRFRFLLEWGIITLCVRLQSLTGIHPSTHFLRLLSTDDQIKPKFTASLIRISTLLCIQLESDENNSRKLLSRLVVLSASSRVAIRHEAQWHFPILWKHAISKCWRSITEDLIFSEFFSFIESLEKYQESPRGRLLTAFDPGCDMNLRTLFQGGYLEVDPPQRRLFTVNEFKKIVKNIKEIGFDEDTIRPMQIPIGPDDCSYATNQSREDSPPSEQQKPVLLNGDPLVYDVFAPLQTKSHSLSFRESNFEHPWKRTFSTQLIVIASLIENPHNLGGICRVSEIFGAQEIHISSLAIANDKAFRSVSVTAELHISVIETAPSSLVGVLREKKEQGFSLVGIEQTDSSLILPAACDDIKEQRKQLPEKCVLILGAERTGIPASILGVVDHCIEIRQWGVIRSLNVQTAAAIVCYEWRRIWEESEEHAPALERVVKIRSIDSPPDVLVALTGSLHQ